MGPSRSCSSVIPRTPLSMSELWEYVRNALEENNADLQAFARKYLGRPECFVDPVWQPSPGVFVLAIYEEDSPTVYRSVALEPCFSQAAIHLRVSDVTEKCIKTDWEETASESED